MTHQLPKLLNSVAGFQGRANDIVGALCNVNAGSNQPAQFKGTVLFFPGDVQDLHDVQAKHRDNSRYLCWSIENTCQLLTQAFPHQHIFVVRPVRKQLGTFSCYDNFLQSDNLGNPQKTFLNGDNISGSNVEKADQALRDEGQWYDVNHGCLQHLHELLESLSLQLQCVIGPLKVIGFSKGIVVLNQIVHELAHYKESRATLPGQLSGLQELVWLDGGHNGGPGAIYVTNQNILEEFASYNINVDVRLTPYQDQCSRRPWIHKECKTFTRLMTQLTTTNSSTATVKKKLYFEHEAPTIDKHFNIIRTLLDE